MSRNAIIKRAKIRRCREAWRGTCYARQHQCYLRFVRETVFGMMPGPSFNIPDGWRGGWYALYPETQKEPGTPGIIPKRSGPS